MPTNAKKVNSQILHYLFSKKRRMDVLSPVILSQFLHGMAIVGLRDREVTQLILGRIVDLVDVMTVDSIIAMLDSLALLGWYDQVSANEVGDTLSRNMDICSIFRHALKIS